MINISFFQAGYCTHLEALAIQGGSWKSVIFPALFALINHPSGYILFDTGYSDRFFQETQFFPQRIYAWITPVYLQPQESAVDQLQKQGIPPEAIHTIIISHFHADHIGGLRDFPNAQLICCQSAYQAVKYKQGWEAFRSAFLPELLPDDFEKRLVFVEDKPQVSLPPDYAPFETGFDLLEDGNLLAIELPGHVVGQVGLCLKNTQGEQYFLIADACWLSRAYQELLSPPRLADLIFADRKSYQQTLEKIHQLYQRNPKIKIIPSHCSQTWQSLQNRI